MNRMYNSDEAKYSCYVFLGDEPEQKKIITIFCRVLGHTKEEAHEKITKELTQNMPEHSFNLHYVGLINFPNIDQELVDRQDEIFEKFDVVWVLKGIYK